MRLQKFCSPVDGARIGVRAYPEVDERVPVTGSYSEVMLHFGLTGKPIEVSLVRNTYINGRPVPESEGRPYVAQVWKDGTPFSAPILTSEAGFYEDETGQYCYPDVNRLPSELKYLLRLRPPYPTELVEAP